MITWVDCLLARWGRWAIRRGLDGIGYPKSSPIFKQYKGDDAYGSEPPSGFVENDLHDCDKAVQSLPSVLKIVVIQHYQTQSSIRHTSKLCGISHKSVKQYIGSAHGMIARELDERRTVTQSA